MAVLAWLGFYEMILRFQRHKPTRYSYRRRGLDTSNVIRYDAMRYAIRMGRSSHPIVRATTTLPRVYTGVHGMTCTIKQKKTHRFGTYYHLPNQWSKHRCWPKLFCFVGRCLICVHKLYLHAHTHTHTHTHTENHVLRNRSSRRQTKGRLDNDTLTKFHRAEKDCKSFVRSFETIQ